jgi:acetylglutamate kinase
MQELTIVKVGGKVVEESHSLQQLLKDFAALPSPKILVHGGGRSATAMATRLGIETKMVEGRRITDTDMLEVVTMVYGGLVNKNIVAGLQSHNQNAIGMTGADMNIIRSRKRINSTIDYGFVGDIEAVNSPALRKLLNDDTIPVIAPLTHDGKGNLLNTNADTIASSIAAAMADSYKVTLVFCFEKKGVLSDTQDENSVIPLITPKEYQILKDKKIVVEGMIPKLDNGFNALQKGVYQIRITNISGLSDPNNKGTILRLK